MIRMHCQFAIVDECISTYIWQLESFICSQKDGYTIKGSCMCIISYPCCENGVQHDDCEKPAGMGLGLKVWDSPHPT